MLGELGKLGTDLGETGATRAVAMEAFGEKGPCMLGEMEVGRSAGEGYCSVGASAGFSKEQ